MTHVVWTGCDKIVSCSEDTSIKVWSIQEGLIRDLNPSHAHWVNTLSLNTYYSLRYVFLDIETLKTAAPNSLTNPTKLQNIAEKNYQKRITKTNEIIASGSDDATIILWDLSKPKPLLKRLVGHKNAIN